MLTIGLTGSIGMGKSTTASLFRDEGVPVFDADAAVHDLYSGEAAEAVDTIVPGVVRDGIVDRDDLRRRVVGDPAALVRLEHLIHPLVRRERDRFLRSVRDRGVPVAVLDIPLLFETGGDAQVDAVVVVSAPFAVQKARVLARPGMTAERFSAILARQMPDDEKRRRARFVVDTGSGLEHARTEVRAILDTLRRESRGERMG